MQPTIALKVDVDTYAGTRDGVPRLLDIFSDFGIRATFYFSLGPDNSGKAIRRIVTRKGFLGKMLRTRAPSMYGLKTMLYGTLLPAPSIAASFPHLLRLTAQKGHETGIHCWDHVKWHDFLPRFSCAETEQELEKAAREYARIFGRRATTTAAPGWTVSTGSLSIQDTMQLAYSSDARGRYPFYPVMAGHRFRTLQIPTTWPTMDELLGENGITPDTINDHYLTLVKPGLNVHTIHAELEGGRLSGTFTDLLEKLTTAGASFIRLDEAAIRFGTDAPASPLVMGVIAGRAGQVALQL